MEFIELTATIRKTRGNNAAKALRRQAQIPAVLYGPGTEPVVLSIQAKDFEQALKTGQVGQLIFNLKIKNGKTSTRSAMIKELQVHPISQQYLHADFYEIAMDRKIKIKIPVITTGKSRGVEMGGTLQLIRRELEVSCLPNEIPDTIELDVTDLDIGDSIHVEDISLTGDVEISAEVNFTVVTVSSPRVEEKVEEGEEEVEGEEVAAEADASEDDGAEAGEDG